MEFQGHKKGQLKKNTNEVHLYEGGAHFSYEDMCRRLEKIARVLNQTINNLTMKRNSTKTGLQGVGLTYNNGLNKNFINPSGIVNKTKSHQFGIEIKNLNKGKDIRFSKDHIIQGKKNFAQSDTKIVLPLININSQNQINTAVTTRDSIKQGTVGIRNAAFKNSMNFKDMVNFYTSSSDSLQTYNLNNSDRKMKYTSSAIKINVNY
jgi:hypothetical protein